MTYTCEPTEERGRFASLLDMDMPLIPCSPFAIGVAERTRGMPRHGNPYLAFTEERRAWFQGWDFGEAMGHV